VSPPGIVPHAFWFGEDQARYVITTTQSQPLLDRAKAAGVPLVPLGTTGGYGSRWLPGNGRCRLRDLKRRFEAWLPGYMAGTI
jgi:phosphoribosylformylglycinamidine synthase